MTLELHSEVTRPNLLVDSSFDVSCRNILLFFLDVIGMIRLLI